MEITSIKPSKNNPNVGQSQIPASPITPKSPESEVVEATTVPDESNPIIDVKDRLGLQSEFLNKISLSVSAQEHQEVLLRRLREKINTKKKEFEELANSDQAHEEEKPDLKRALSRMDRIIEIPEKSKLLQSQPEVFSEYVNDLLNYLLEHDARLLNFILACTPTEDADLIERKVLYWDPEPQSKEELITKLRESLPQWDSKGYLHYLLPGLPIVVKAKGLPTLYEKRYEEKPVSIRANDLSETDLNKLTEAAIFIRLSGWLEAVPQSLKITESINLIDDAPFHGVTANKGHPIIALNDEVSALALAGTMIHEDWHYVVHDGPYWGHVQDFDYENRDKFPSLKHPWISENGTRVSLLSECEVYGMESKFHLQLLNWGGINDKQVVKITEKLLKHKENAKDAISLLRQNPEYLNDKGKEWLSKNELLWEEINSGFQAQLTEYYLDRIFSIEDRNAGRIGYRALIELDKNTSCENNTYLEKYFEEISRDNVALSLLNQASPFVNSGAKEEFRSIARNRLIEPSILEKLMNEIEIRTQTRKESDRERWGDYFLMGDSWLVCESHREDIGRKFSEFIADEDHVGLLEQIATSEAIPPPLQELAKIRIELARKLGK